MNKRLLKSLTFGLLAVAMSVHSMDTSAQNKCCKNRSKGETVVCRGQNVHTNGMMPAVGTTAPDFTAVNGAMEDVHLKDYSGKIIVLNIFPSVDTPTCAKSVRQFNADASQMDNAVVLCLSKDLPFAQKRFCAAEGLANVIPLSLFRSNDFRKSYGLTLADGPLKGLMARAVIVIGKDGKICYEELVKDVSHEPDYKAAIEAVKRCNQ